MFQKWEEIRHTWTHGIVFRHVKNKKLNMWSPKNKLSTLRFCKIIFSYKYIWVSCSQEWTHLITKLDTCAYGDLAWTCVRPNLLTRFLAYLDWWDVNIPFCDCLTYPTHLKLIFISLEDFWLVEHVTQYYSQTQCHPHRSMQ